MGKLSWNVKINLAFQRRILNHQIEHREDTL